MNNKILELNAAVDLHSKEVDAFIEWKKNQPKPPTIVVVMAVLNLSAWAALIVAPIFYIIKGSL